MDKEFIPYEQSLELKELGFDEVCMGGYDLEDNSLYIGYISDDGIQYNPEYYTPAPLYQQAFRWFREKYGYNCFVVTSIIDGRYFYFRENIKDRREDSEPELTTKFDTYEEAELDCLKKLIQILKTK